MIKIKYIEFLFIVIYIVLIFVGVKHFVIWSQVSDILIENDMGNNFINVGTLILTNHPHASRVALMLPFYTISEYFNVNLELFFSFIVLFILILIYYIFLIILKNILPRKKMWPIFLFVLILSLFMHGRIVFSIFGNTILLFILHNRYYSNTRIKLYKFIFFFLMALWFVSVSSGTLSVFLSTIIIFLLFGIFINLPYISKKTIWVIVGFFIVFILLTPILKALVEKNLNYFGGSIIHMMSHGLGAYLIKYSYFILISILLITTLAPIIIHYIRHNKILILPISMIFASFLIGLFGFSSLVSGVPAYILFYYLYKYRKISKHV